VYVRSGGLIHDCKARLLLLGQAKHLSKSERVSFAKDIAINERDFFERREKVIMVFRAGDI